MMRFEVILRDGRLESYRLLKDGEEVLTGDAGHLLQQPFDIGVGHDLERSGIVAHRVALLRGAQRLGLLDDRFDLHARLEFQQSEADLRSRDPEGRVEVVVAQESPRKRIFAVGERRNRHRALEGRGEILFLLRGFHRRERQHRSDDALPGVGVDDRGCDAAPLGECRGGEKRQQGSQ